MKLLSITVALLMSVLWGPQLLAAGAESGTGAAASPAGPQIQFGSKQYDFGRVTAGQIVKHSFVFTNAGSATLRINGVYPSCGCTTAGNWSRQVEPGKTGVIPLQFNSSHFLGPITKTATVTSNDKHHPSVTLQLHGTVWRPIAVTPQVAVLNVPPDATTNTQTSVRIVSSLDQPLTLSNPQCNNHAFAAHLKTIRPGKEFQLVIRTVPPLAHGTVQGRISIKTSSAKMPTLSVTALAIVQPAVVVMPPQITLPQGPVKNAFAYSVTIRNNSVKPLSLSDPSVNMKGVGVHLKEIQPGRQFAVTLTFPAGFEIARGKPMDLTVKTSNPKHAVIKVPVRQAFRPRPQAWHPRTLQHAPTSPAVRVPRPAGGA